MSRIVGQCRNLLANGSNACRIASRGLPCAISSSVRHLSTTEGTKEEKRRKKSNLYTKTGDAGTSSLYNGERRPKNELVFDVLGHQDELNAVIGIAREHCALTQNGLDEMLIEIQSRLFDLGAAVATPVQTSSNRKKAYTEFSQLHTATIESWIDQIDSTLPPIVNFVIPSGGMSSTHLNLARAVCRR
jgi:cob(I)alamin adenosyltransferase